MVTYSIYIVDDEQSLAKGIALGLPKEYRTNSFTTAETALRSMKEDTPDLVLLDIGLPGMNGVEVYQSLERRNIKLPFIFITAVDDDVLVDQAKRLGKAFFQKPLDGQELLGVLSTLSRT
jgi:two-component system response regulator AtoC